MEVADLFATLGLKPDERAWKRGSELIEGMHHALEFFVAWEAVKFLGDMVESVTKAAIGAERLSQKLGISTKDVQELGYAARVSGVDAEQLQVGMQRLARNLDEARTKGTGDAADAFSRLGISMADPMVKAGDLGETIGLLADKFSKMPDNATKTALAIELFGRSGTALIPMLNQGKAGIAAFRKEAEDLGIVISQDDAKAFEKFEQDQIRLQATWEGLKNTVVKALLPALQDMLAGFSEWVKANKELIASTLKSVIESLVVAVKALGVAFQAVAAVIDFFKEHTDLATAIIIALGVVIAAFAVEAAISWAIAFWPLTLIVAVIAAIVLVFMDLWRSITTGRGVFASAFNWMADQVKEFWDGLVDIADKIAGFFTGVASGIKGAFTSAFEWIADKAEWLADKIENMPVISQLIDAGAWVGNTVGGLATGGASEPEAAPSRPSAASGTQTVQGTTVSVNAPVTINAKNADATQVQKLIEQHHEQIVRDVYAGTGGADVGMDIAGLDAGTP